ncbi:MAG: HDOD domain-containing protein, partial [Chloroflexi bacterium]|nr:HDOD domain-containing protein [Chloroflexota bacterium]
MEEKRRILFVDDQPNVLDGLRRMFRKFRDKWDMEFAAGGAEALAAMEKRPVDVIVADMKMPEMNGAQLLRRVSELYPGTVRFILSGHSDRELILQSVGYAHQYLAKPCAAETLEQTIRNSIGLRELLLSKELQAKIAGIGTLPSCPETYNKLVVALQSETSSVEEVAEIVSQDVGMTAKLLQMINSAFFCLPTHVGSIYQAVSLLGLDTVQGLALTAGVFRQFNDPGLSGISVESVYNHSIAVGTAAKKIAGALGLNERETEDALMAGMLHDVGKLIMLAHFRSELSRAIQLAEKKSVPLHKAERQTLGVTHGEIGAHLLSLWG